MPIDTSMYRNMQLPDFLGSYQRGKDMYAKNQEREKAETVAEAKKGLYKMGEDGKMQLNPEAMDRYAEVAPQDAYEEDQKYRKNQIAEKRNQYQTQIEQYDIIGRTLGGVQNQEQYDLARQSLLKAGVDREDIEAMPGAFDPEMNGMLAGKSMSQAQRLADEARQQGFDFQKEKFGYQRQKDAKEFDLRKQEKAAAAKAKAKTTGLSVGQKKVDQEWAKEYNDWTSGGSDVAKTEVGKLKDVVLRLKAGQVSTGGATGMFPDRMTSDEVLSARSDVQSTVMNSLRAILGAQFTEKEGERIIKNTWNEADSTENNVGRIERLVGDLESKAMAKDAKSQYYQENDGTLKDYVYQPPERKEIDEQYAGSQQGRQKIGMFPEAHAGPSLRRKTSEIEWAD